MDIPIHYFLRSLKEHLAYITGHRFSGGKVGYEWDTSSKEFLMYGKNVPAMEVRDTQMWDITPTLLYALDVKIPSYGWSCNYSYN